MATSTRHINSSARTIEARIRRQLLHLKEIEAADLARIVHTLVQTFQPEQIYLFGSQARGTSNWHSDVDLLVVVPDGGELPHRRAQEAYRAVGHHILPLDIIFMDREQFDWRAEVVTSLPATVLREGHLLYAAGTA
jgi:predicted nucleotidyltransferase